jgi:phage baseplate assembly protein gpV
MNKKRYLVIVGIVVAAVVLPILFYTMLVNHRPIITSLEAEGDWTTPSTSLQVMCNASDPDGDELSYAWSASAGEVNGDGDTVTWIAPPSEGSYSVAVAVTDGRGGEIMKQVTITVRPSTPPTIVSLTADADWTLPSGSLQVTCNAFDPDGDEISYEWSTTGGDISGTGPTVIWIAPEEVGIHHVTVVVTDSHGRSATNLLSISVATEQPPIIEALLITKDRYGHCYLLPYFGGYKVGKGHNYDIECSVSDTSGELIYEWSCDGGELSGEGSLITWTAPNASIDVTVTVIVSDIAGNMMTKNIVLYVVQCSACTFGC